ncbi:MAG TPA: hypothetical protein VE591_14530, partial [Candidatus Acidoferrum sp.]|nr:hypothetical protein [Candidatus Acidoferrum sp.]
MDRNREIPPEALWDQPTQIFEARVIQERGVARARAKAAVAAYGSPIPPNLSRMLLPGEMLTLASRPHPIVFLVPSLAVLAVAIVFGVVLTSGTQQIVHGHWVDVPWVGGWMRTAVAALGGAALLRGLLSLTRA